MLEVKKLIFHHKEFLVLEIFAVAQNSFTQFLYGFDQQAQSFEVWNKFTSQVSRHFITLNQFNNTCFGSFTPGFNSLEVICDDPARNFLLQTSSPIQMVTTSNQLMILLFVDRHLEVWSDLKAVQALNIQNPVCLASIKWKNKYYLAVCSDRMDDSIHYGSIEIYER